MPDPRLSKIETLWTVVREANDGSAPAAQAAQEQLLERYGGAVRRYLLAALRDEGAADEVFQEFALRFVRGDFSNADPRRGRFRSFVKTAVYHLIVDHQRRGKRDRQRQQLAFEPQDAEVDLRQMETEFTASWRDELLSRAWDALAQHEATTGKPYHSVLTCRAERPAASSPEIAAELTERLGRDIAPGNARVLVHRARELFAEFLVDAVRESLANPARDDLEEELITLDLLTYCRAALDKRR